MHVEAHQWDKPCRWRNLNVPQKMVLANGCGPKAAGMVVPDFIWTASCDQHDFNYWLGRSEEDRKRADRQFHAAMRGDVALMVPWWRRPLAYFVAWRYYRAVRHWGCSCFHYSTEYRTWKDIQAI